MPVTNVSYSFILKISKITFETPKINNKIILFEFIDRFQRGEAVLTVEVRD